MMLKNYMEDLVWERLDELFTEYPNACQCERCRYDIVAFALNLLPTRYVVTQKGEMYTRLHTLEQQFYVDIIAALTRAIIVVNMRPRHNDME